MKGNSTPLYRRRGSNFFFFLFIFCFSFFAPIMRALSLTGTVVRHTTWSAAFFLQLVSSFRQVPSRIRLSPRRLIWLYAQSVAMLANESLWKPQGKRNRKQRLLLPSTCLFHGEMKSLLHQRQCYFWRSSPAPVVNFKPTTLEKAGMTLAWKPSIHFVNLTMLK